MSDRKINLEGLSNIALPVRLIDLDGKYYGTRIVDAQGEEVVRLWTAEGDPSEREKQSFGNWSPAAWADYVCDSHWECERDHLFAEYLVQLLNASIIPTHEMNGRSVKRDSFQSPDISDLDQ